MKSLVFGLTGGIACGKSTVSRVFSENGVRMVDADIVAREVVAPGSPALLQLVSVFGAEILLADGSLDRPKLGAIVFADSRKCLELDQTLHGFIKDSLQRQLKAAKSTYSLVGFEAPLLIERGYHNEYRPLIVVSTTHEIQLKRLMERDGFNQREAEARIASQLPLEEKVRLADYVIWNNGSQEDITHEALQVLSRLKELQ